MLADGQRTKWSKNTAENFNRLSRVHQRYRQTTNRRTDDDIANVSKKRKDFFSKNLVYSALITGQKRSVCMTCVSVSVCVYVRVNYGATNQNRYT